ncbi:IDEAL domain-containing protein [Cytobacillus oceanisediminis]|uniref:IDEAL domain-containing protein n=1 Tax=Cytobacillus oceanisediminis TaxID=665099 RepID=A0A562JPH9_9BACI|nr:IDEAL domain-containing protein [Cytobacillus oceanisediminis]TWH85082.1 IDEAL domain-containing protein [Cytobacillus oceanisediminis]
MKEKSYTELMKASAMKRKQQKESFVLDLYIDMLISEILLNTEKEKLMKKVDAAIDEGNKQAFILLSNQYRELSKRFGT